VSGALVPFVGSFGIVGVESTRTGLMFSNPRLPFDEWEAVGAILGAARDWTAWSLGDWLLFGEATFGEAAYQAAAATGRSATTLGEYARVAGVFPPNRRRVGVSWSHHQAVASRRFEPDERDSLLEQAEAEDLSLETFRELVRAHASRRLGDGDETSGTREPTEPVWDVLRAFLAAVETDRASLRASPELLYRLVVAFVEDVDGRYAVLVDALAAAEVKPAAVVVKRNGRNAKRARRGVPPKPTLSDEARAHAEREVERRLRAPTDPELKALAADLEVADRLRDLLDELSAPETLFPTGSKPEWA
jgi:hypothetical protein